MCSAPASAAAAPVAASAAQPLVDTTFVNTAAPFWGNADADALAQQLEACYVARAKPPAWPKGAPATPKPNRTLSDLQTDFDEVADAAFNRSGYATPFHAIDVKLAAIMLAQRAKIEAIQVPDEASPDGKKKRKLTEDEKAAQLTATANQERADIADVASIAAWGWMVERRERLDYETVDHAPGARAGSVAAITPTEAERQRAVFDQVALTRYLSQGEKATAVKEARTSLGLNPEPPRKPTKEEKADPTNRPLTAAEYADAMDTFQRAHPLSDAQIKQAFAVSAKTLGKKPEDLTDDEKTTAQADALTALKKKVPAASVELRALTMAEEDAGNLVVNPSFAGWERGLTPIHKHVVDIMNEIQRIFGSFHAGTYGDPHKGTHGSGGFQGRFRSIDAYPQDNTYRHGETLKFFDQQPAYEFAMAIDDAAANLGFTYQILYDDFVVLREFNKRAKHGSMSLQDNVEKACDTHGVCRPANLNWHGPLVTHFHIDFAF